MRDNSLHQDLHTFAIELRKLAYTMPAGHEDRLIHLSERMAHHAGQLGVRQHGARQRSAPRRAGAG